MHDFEEELTRRLDRIRQQNLYRQLREIESPQSPHCQIGGRSFLNFSSNDYLGLANHPILKGAAIGAIERYGAGSGSARLVCGSLAPHHELEEKLARFKGAEAALVFSSGYASAIGTIAALADSHDIIAIDRLVHASIVDAARLSGAKLRVFAHNDLEALEKILRWADRRSENDPRRSESASDRASSPGARRARTLIVTETVFSMDGDHAPLKGLVELKDRFGAWLMVDEAHATGLYGLSRRGLAEQAGVSDRIEIQMGTLGKALGASGGYICGSRKLIDYLINRARSFVFSTAPVPAAAAAASAGISVVQSPEGETRRQELWQRIEQLSAGIGLEAAASLRAVKPDNTSSYQRSAIFPLIVGEETTALQFSAALYERGILIPAIRYPTVARGHARLRVTATAAHTRADIKKLIEAFGEIGLLE